MQDPIADMLTRVRNASAASLKNVTMPSSKMKAAVADVLKQEGYISDFQVDGDEKKKTLTIKLKFYKNKPVIEGIKRISRPSCRIYCGSNDIPKVRNGLGTVVLSTPQGIISDKNARANNVGGEILCYVW
jgi:small subunit ribosomal protein S8